MSIAKWIEAAALVASGALAISPVWAEDVFPQHPVKVIVQTAAGSSIDVAARIVAASLSRRWGQQVVVINQPGAGGAIAAKSQALTDVISGRVPIVVDSLSAFIGPSVGGQIRILAVGSAQRLKNMPDVPAMSETLPGFEATAWVALVAPPGTPPALAAKISKDVEAVLDDNAVVARLDELGTYVKRMSSGELTAFIKDQRAKWAPVVQKFGVP